MVEYELGKNATAVLSAVLVIIGICVSVYFKMSGAETVQYIGMIMTIFGAGGLAVSNPLVKKKEE